MQVVSHHTLLPPPASAKATRMDVKAEPVAQVAAPQAAEKPSGIWQSGKFSFGDFIDMINPLQHLPVISGIYRKFTGDEMGDAARMIGGAIYGAVLGSWISGLASAVANVFVSHSTGKDIPEHVMDVAELAVPVRAEAKQPFNPQPVITPNHAERIIPPSTHPVALAAAEERGQTDPVSRAAVSPAALQPASTRDLVEEVVQLQQSQVFTAIAHYKQQISIDDLKRDSHYWV